MRKAERWVARLLSTPSTRLDALLDMPLGLDVWERHDDAIVVVASETQLSELERRKLARVERLCTVKEFKAQALRRSSREEDKAGEEQE